jgi:FHA domain-containing protein
VPITLTPVPASPVVDGVDLVLGETEPAPLGAGLVEALYRGLGVAMPTAPSAEQLELIGALLRGAIGGTLELLAARNIAKRELGANPTLLQTRENNPLKFSPDVDAALGHLLGPAQRGFIAPRAAVNDAFDDLNAHEMAVLAGMRGALDAVLARFDPGSLELRLGQKAMWQSLLPAARKSRLWERYAEQYAQILREIEGDFDSLFGRAFLQAYQAQLAELAEAKR